MIEFQLHGFTYRTNADATAIDVKGRTWKRTDALIVQCAALRLLADQLVDEVA